VVFSSEGSEPLPPRGNEKMASIVLLDLIGGVALLL
jgi:hypothetical protein